MFYVATLASKLFAYTLLKPKEVMFIESRKQHILEYSVVFPYTEFNTQTQHRDSQDHRVLELWGC